MLSVQLPQDNLQNTTALVAPLPDEFLKAHHKQKVRVSGEVNMTPICGYYWVPSCSGRIESVYHIL